MKDKLSNLSTITRFIVRLICAYTARYKLNKRTISHIIGNAGVICVQLQSIVEKWQGKYGRTADESVCYLLCEGSPARKNVA